MAHDPRVNFVGPFEIWDTSLLRMIDDSSHQLAWLAWSTPFGLTARTAPYADNRTVPLIAFPTDRVKLRDVSVFVDGEDVHLTAAFGN